jgi:hypothetical protein
MTAEMKAIIFRQEKIDRGENICKPLDHPRGCVAAPREQRDTTIDEA